MGGDVAVVVDPDPIRVQLKEGSPELLIDFRVQASVPLASILAAATQARAQMAEPRQDVPEVASNPASLDFTSLCVGGVPDSWQEAQVREAHHKLGIADSCLTEVRGLAAKLASDTGCTVFRYADENSAAEALIGLNGMSVATPRGREQCLHAQYATAAAAARAGCGGAIVKTQSRAAQCHVERPLVVPTTAHKAPVGFERISVPKAPWLNGVTPPAPRVQFKETVSTLSDSSMSACAVTPELSTHSCDGRIDHDDLPSIYVSDLPADITDGGIRRILRDVGLDPDLLVSANILPPTAMLNTTCAVLRYASPTTHMHVAAAIQGHQLILPTGEVRVLHAKLADSQRSSTSAVNSGCNSNDSSFGPDIYLSEVPQDWSADHVKELHRSVGFDPVSISGVQMLPGDNADSARGSAAIIQYSNQSAASAAMQMLQGKVAALAPGERRPDGRAGPVSGHVPGQYTAHVRQARKVSTRIFMALDNEIQRVAGGWSQAHDNFINRAEHLSAALGEQHRARAERLEDLRHFQQQCHSKLERLGLPFSPPTPCDAEMLEN